MRFGTRGSSASRKAQKTLIMLQRRIVHRRAVTRLTAISSKAVRVEQLATKKTLTARMAELLRSRELLQVMMTSTARKSVMHLLMILKSSVRKRLYNSRSRVMFRDSRSLSKPRQLVSLKRSKSKRKKMASQCCPRTRLLRMLKKMKGEKAVDFEKNPNQPSSKNLSSRSVLAPSSTMSRDPSRMMGEKRQRLQQHVTRMTLRALSLRKTSLARGLDTPSLASSAVRLSHIRRSKKSYRMTRSRLNRKRRVTSARIGKI